MKTLKRTAFALAAVTALTSLLSLAACGDPPKNRITLSVWTYYNNQQDSAFRRIIDEFNDTEGKEKAIYVTSSSYSNPTKIAEEVEKNAKKELPEIFQLYSDDLKKSTTPIKTSRRWRGILRRPKRIYTSITSSPRAI